MWLGAMYEYAGMGKPAVSIEILRTWEKNQIEREQKRERKEKSFMIYLLNQ